MAIKLLSLLANTADEAGEGIRKISDSLHSMVQKEIGRGRTKRQAFDDVSKSTGVPVNALKKNEKLFARESGGGASKDFIDELTLIFKALTKPSTEQQKIAEDIGGETKRTRKKQGITGIGGFGVGYSLGELDLPPEKASEFEQAFSKAHNAGEETFTFDGKEYSTEVKKGKAMGGSMLSRQNYDEGSEIQTPEEALDDQVRFYDLLMKGAKTPAQEKEIAESFGDSLVDILQRKVELSGHDPDEEFFPKKEKAMGGRINYQEGGSLMVPPEMEGMANDMPVDTYPNIPPEEMAEAEASQLPDEEMEDKYMDFVITESLDTEEQTYLMNALEADPQLSQIFDKVVTTASEFTGAGEVEGPGTGVSDSIPARLSDGEFVFTKKATDQLGSDNLQTMMDDAERNFDGGKTRSPVQTGGLLYAQKDGDPLAYEKIAQDEIKKSMLRSNRAPSLMG